MAAFLAAKGCRPAINDRADLPWPCRLLEFLPLRSSAAASPLCFVGRLIAAAQILAKQWSEALPRNFRCEHLFLQSSVSGGDLVPAEVQNSHVCLTAIDITSQMLSLHNVKSGVLSRAREVVMAFSNADIQELVDRNKIYGALVAHARGIDRCELAALSEAYWDDAQFDEPDFPGPFMDWGPMFLDIARRYWEVTHHSISNVRMKIEGALAYSESYVLSYHRTRSEATREEVVAGIGEEAFQRLGGRAPGCYEFLVGGRNLDRLEERGGVWKIISRRVAFDWNHTGLYTGMLSGGLYDKYQKRGSRGADDPSYGLSSQH